MRPNKSKNAFILLRQLGITVAALSPLFSGCAKAADQGGEPPKPAYVVPLFDGRENAPKDPPKGEYKLAPLPNARELFDMTIACYPEKSWFRGELSAESRITQRGSTSTTTFDPVSGQYQTSVGQGDKYVGLVFRIPLFSAAELDREREREIGRRARVADAVGDFVAALAEWQMVEREIVLMKSLEARAQQRVGLGVTATDEQVKYLEKVASLDRAMVGFKAKLIRARVTLVGMCASDKSWVLDEYLMRYREVE